MPSDNLSCILTTGPTWADENGDGPTDEMSNETDMLTVTGKPTIERGPQDVAALTELRGPIE